MINYKFWFFIQLLLSWSEHLKLCTRDLHRMAFMGKVKKAHKNQNTQGLSGDNLDMVGNHFWSIFSICIWVTRNKFLRKSKWNTDTDMVPRAGFFFFFHICNLCFLNSYQFIILFWFSYLKISLVRKSSELKNISLVINSFFLLPRRCHLAWETYSKGNHFFEMAVIEIRLPH